MKDVVKEWVDKAEGDFATALREYRVRKDPNNEAVCFHAQQCIEKYLKAVLQMHSLYFDKTHDLLILLKKCLPKYPSWETAKDKMDMLSHFAVQFRYPGESAMREDARRAIRAMKQYRI